MKYCSHKVTFAEVPDEISLCIEVSGCVFHCKGCHSPWLWEDRGEELTSEVVEQLVKKAEGITCLCIMGGSEKEVVELLKNLMHLGVKLAWYTGQIAVDFETKMVLDYVKLGPYVESQGPLTSPTTNQRFYKIDHIYTIGRCQFWKDSPGPYAIMTDITSKFYEKV